MALADKQKTALVQACTTSRIIRDALAAQRTEMLANLIVIDRQLTEATQACSELTSLLEQIAGIEE